MADQKISDLPDGGDPQDTDDFVVARGVTNNKIAWSSMSNAVVTAVTASQIAASADGNTAGALALVSSGTLILAGGNNITLSQAGNAITISGVSIPAESQTFIGAIQASDTTYTSGTVVLTGSGAATVKSGTGQQVIIDVPAQSVQPETQTFVAGVGNSQTTYSSGTVNLSVEGGLMTIRSTTGQAFRFSVSQSVQPETQTFLGGLAGSNTTYTSGTVTLSGVGGGVTVNSNTGQRIDISVAAPVAQSAQTGISGIANSQTTYTSGTVSLSELGAITIRSTTGNQYQFSVNAQSVQPETQTFVGGVGNSQTTYTSGTVNLSVNGGLLTIRSTTGNAFQFSVSQSVQAETQTFVGGIANSETTYTSGSVTLSALANITIRSTTGQQFQFSVPGTTGTGNLNAISNSNTTYTSGTIGLSELGAITIRSTTGNQFQFSVNSQSVQPETQTFVGGIGNSQTTYTSGTVNLSVVAGNLTIRSTTGNAFQFSMSQTVQAETQTAISGIANSQTTYTSGTVSLSELGAITIRSTTGNQYQFSVAAQTGTYQSAIAASNTTYTSGLVVFTGSNMITVKSSAAGQTVIIDATQTNQSAIKALGASNTGNTAGNTGVSTGIDWVLAGTNNVTISQSTAGGGPNTLWVSGPTAAAAQTGISGFANSETTYTSGSVTLSALANITIRSTTGQQFQFSVAGTTGTGNLNAISNSNTTYTSGTIGLSELGAITIRSTTGNQFQFSVNSQTVQTQSFLSAGMSTNGNTSGDTGFVTGRLAIMGGNNITLSGSTNAGSMSITISAPNLGAGAFSGGVSTGGNTAGATGITGTQMVFVGTGPISLSQTTGANGGTLSINAPATSSLSATGAVSISTNGSTISIGAPTQTNQAGSVYAVGNSTGTSSGTYDARTLSISGAGMVSVAASNSGYVISATQSTLANIVGASGLSISSNASSLTVYQLPISNMEINSNAMYSSSSSAISQATNVTVIRFIARELASFTRVDIPYIVSLATAAASNTAAHSLSKVMNLYTRNGSTLNAITGTSQTEIFSWASNSANFANLTGPRLISFPLATAITPGEYYIGYYLSTVTFSSVGAANTTNLGGTYGPIFYTGPQTATMWAQLGSATAATSSPVSFMQGVQSISLSATNQTIQATNVTQSGTAAARAGQVLLFRA